MNKKTAQNIPKRSLQSASLRRARSTKRVLRIRSLQPYTYKLQEQLDPHKAAGGERGSIRLFFIVLFLGVSVGTVLGFSGKLIASLHTEHRIAPGTTASEKEVLGATDNLSDESISFNVPASLHETVNFGKDIAVGGNATFKGNITAANMVYGVSAGNGLSVSGGQNPMLANTGVLSIGGQTGAVSLTAGTGISVSGLTISNDAKTFKTITVGGTSFSAGSLTDTLTITGGDGMTITPDATNKKLTISASAADLNASGFTDDGTTIRLTTVTDSLGIGTATPATKLHVLGTTEQLRLGYDGTNYVPFTVSSAGNLIIAPSGGSFSITGGLSSSNGLTVSGGSVSLPTGSLGNTALTNSSITVTAGTGLSGGGAVALGSSVSLANAGVTSLTGTTNQVTVSGSTGTVTLSLPQSIDTSSTPTFAGENVNGAVVVAPSVSNATAMTLRASSTSPGNILDITNAAGSSSYLTIGATGTFTVNGSTLTNAGLLESGGAIHLTNSANAVVGTAIEGGWTMNSNAFTYRRIVTVTNNDGSNALPVNYEVTVTLSGATASQIYTNAQANADDFRIAYNSTEIKRNITTFTSSSIIFTFQIQSQIAAAGSDSNYYVFYKNSSLVCSACTYTGNIQLDSLDSQAASWTSTDTTQFPLADEATLKNEGTGSLKASATVDNIGTFSTTSQNGLPGARTNFGFTSSAISGTTYLYAVGGSSDGTATNGQTSVYRTSVAGATGNVAAWNTNANSLSAAVMDNSVVVAAPAFDGGTGADGTLDLSLGSGAGGCNGTGISWNAGTSTCTIATATKSTFNFTTVTIPSGTTLTTDGPKTTTNFVTIKATGNVTIGGTVDLAGKGYSGGSTSGHPGGYGTGAGGYNTFSDFAGGGGGGFGGAGGRGGKHVGYTPSEYAAGGTTYDTADSGSGGGAGENSNFYAAGGAGGGGVKITSGGNVTVSGTINTNGAVGSVNLGISGGGGSGGKVHLQGSAVTVSGSITANGGGGGADSNNVGGGGGGGGRITLEYSGSVNTTGSTITVTAGAKGGSGYNAADGSAGASTQVSSNPILFVFGGKNTSGTAQAGISQATITPSDGSVGAFSASSVSLPQALFGQTSNVVTVGTTNYLYIVGGNNGTSDQLTVYKGTFSGANISAIATTSQTQLGTGISYQAAVTGSISGSNYIWVLGGLNGSTAQTSVYRGTIDSSGNITALSTTSQGALPQALYGHKALFVTVGSNNYIYVYGGKNSAGTRQTTVYKATVDGSGNVGTFTTVGQTQLSSAISDFGAFNFTDGSSNQYAYIIGGNTGTAQTAVLKSKFTPIDQTGYSMSRTITSSNWSNKNNLTFQVYSSRTGSYMNLQFYDATGGWQTCTFSVSSSNTWETKTCDISGVSSANKDAVTSLKVVVSSSSSTAWTMYLDDINAKTNAATVSNSTSALAAVLGASNLTLNAQGTGIVALNYDPSNGQAGTGGMKIYDGAAGELFSLSGTGTASAAGALTLTGASSSARMNILNGQNLILQTSAGGDAGLVSRLTLLNNGNTGIGTTTPAFRLDITDTQASTLSALISNTNTGASGSVLGLKTGAATAGTGNNFLTFLNGNGQIVGKVTGNGSGGVSYTTTGIDFAEYYKKADISESFAAGDLVCLSKAGGATRCSNTEKDILGIVSGNAGFVGGVDHARDKGYVLVGLVGQLPVKVASTSGEIFPGDGLTSSDVLGLATKASGSGMIVGKALEAKTDDEGVVVVTIGVRKSDTVESSSSLGMSESLVKVLGENTTNTTNLFSDTTATVSGTLTVLGRGLFTDIGVTGKISNGLMMINGLEGQLYTLSGPLKLQSAGLGGIDLLSGKVVIDTSGNIKTAGTISAAKVETDEVVVGQKSAGSAILSKGEQTLEIKADAAHPSSRIFLTPTTLTAAQLVVTEKNPGSFTVKIATPQSEDISFDWLIIGSK